MDEKLTPDEATPFPAHHTPTRFERARYGWLIERQHPIVEWWTGLRFDLEDAKAWTCDSTKAIVFGDWASGGAMLNNLQVETMKTHRTARFLERMKLCVTDHMWDGSTPSGGGEHDD